VEDEDIPEEFAEHAKHFEYGRKDTPEFMRKLQGHLQHLLLEKPGELGPQNLKALATCIELMNFLLGDSANFPWLKDLEASNFFEEPENEEKSPPQR